MSLLVSLLTAPELEEKPRTPKGQEMCFWREWGAGDTGSSDDSSRDHPPPHFL